MPTATIEQPRTLRAAPAAERPVERVLTASRLEDLDPDTLGELIGAVDDRLEAVANVDVRARLQRGRTRLELALAEALEQ